VATAMSADEIVRLNVDHSVLEVIENTERFVWLAVRDDFRNWLVTAV